jgi:endonuclease III
MTNNNELIESIDDFERRQAKYAPVAKALREIYGDLDWSRGQDGVNELVSCILSQNTNDTNRDRGFSALKDRYPTWQDVVDAPTGEVIDTIRPAGLANQKAPRIQNALRTIYEERGEYSIDFLQDMTAQEAKDWLTQIKGIGPKTAAIVLCFAYDMPAFPVDTHVHRVGKRIGFLPEKTSADKAHPVMEAIVPPKDYFAFHIYLIRHGRDTCNARTPHCERCPLTEHCDYFIKLSGEDKP